MRQYDLGSCGELETIGMTLHCWLAEILELLKADWNEADS
jgi:hypothetical protein